MSVMRVQPASLDQVLRGQDGRMVLIDREVSQVAADLHAIDPCLKVRFAKDGNPPYWVVYHENEGDTYLVLTQKAHQTAHGTWSGLDQRIVNRVREIDQHGSGGYDLAAEVERASRQAHENRRQERLATLEPIAEQAAHALRKDLGVRYKGRAFVPRNP